MDLSEQTYRWSEYGKVEGQGTFSVAAEMMKCRKLCFSVNKQLVIKNMYACVTRLKQSLSDD